MDSNHISFEEVLSSLTRVRQDLKKGGRFPNEIWDSILQLTKFHPIEEVARKTDLDLSYLRYKLILLQAPAKKDPKSLDFYEVNSFPLPSAHILIELTSSSGLKAKIQGPSSCLSCLEKLFR